MNIKALGLLVTSVLALSMIAAKPAPKPHYREPSTSHLVVIRMDLDFRPHTRSSFGKVRGFDPAETRVHNNGLRVLQ